MPRPRRFALLHRTARERTHTREVVGRLAKRASVIKASSAKRVIVDTTVMPKAIAHPTDSRLLERCREHLVKAAARHGLKLRQN